MGAADLEDDLDPALRERLEGLCARLDAIDHYALLGVARSADRKAIKSAYFAQAAQLHPDRYFGKRLGRWKQKMEAIFGRLSIAHETLTTPQARAEYDAYLLEHERIVAFERALDVDEDSLDPVEERPVNPAAVRSSETRRAVVAPPTSPIPSPEAERARREALARRLAGGTHRRLAAARPPSAPAMPAAVPARAQVGIEALVAAARSALALGDLANASTKMRLAAKIDARYSAEAEEIAKRVHAAMADAYAKQAAYEEAQERWLEAAISWSKALAGRPEEGHFAERAANALCRGGGDLHKAASHGEAAVRLRPNDPRAHGTLASVYLAAGLIRRAKAEIDAALRLAPADAALRDLAKQIAVRS